MGHFLAVTALRSESVPEVVQAISRYLQSHDTKHEVLPGATPPDEATDALVFAPAGGWTVVLWPNYFNIHDFPLARAIASDQPWLVSSVHVYDGDYWEHLAVQGASELHSYCSRPTYWEDAPEELERVAAFSPEPGRLAVAAGVPPGVLAPYIVDADAVSDDAKANPEDQFALSDFWVFTDFWHRLGITYPDPPENPASVIRLSKWFAKRLPQG
jgi:hypothetical protein